MKHLKNGINIQKIRKFAKMIKMNMTGIAKMRMGSYKMKAIIMLMTHCGEQHHKYDNHNQT
ncbi:MAG: hypothetical protein CVU60_13510 [Deltaproteobacteria bacterium HGW-Deltaproteobacteria-18]|jgi:hypothetical protein|nr:MAG: hypothetical protein CVU60_13510 [Deltaproteobacteria bacterium HGW-Deltaproteobacteria-18]